MLIFAELRGPAPGRSMWPVESDMAISPWRVCRPLFGGPVMLYSASSENGTITGHHKHTAPGGYPDPNLAVRAQAGPLSRVLCRSPARN